MSSMTLSLRIIQSPIHISLRQSGNQCASSCFLHLYRASSSLIDLSVSLSYVTLACCGSHLTGAVGGILFQYLARPSGGDSDLRNRVSITKPLVYHSFHFTPQRRLPFLRKYHHQILLVSTILTTPHMSGSVHRRRRYGSCRFFVYSFYSPSKYGRSPSVLRITGRTAYRLIGIYETSMTTVRTWESVSWSRRNS